VAVELRQVFEEARDIAQKVGQPMTTAHVLLAMFTLPNHAQVLMGDRRLNEDRILSVIRRGEEEGARLVQDLRGKTEELADGLGSREVNCLHLLLAMTRLKEAVAHQLLVRSGEDLADLRAKAMGCLSGRMPRRLANFRKTSNLAVDHAPAVPQLAADDGEMALSTAPSVLPPARGPAGDLAPAPRLESPPPQPRAAPGAPRPAAARAPAGAAKPAAAKGPLPRGGLDPGEYPLLCQLGMNLTERAHAGGIDPVVGRDREIAQIVDILGKRRANNALIVGESGVGKTAVVEGLARKAALSKEGLRGLEDRIIVEVDTGTLLAGTQLRGALSERLIGLKEELKKGSGRVIVFIDEIHTLIGAGATSDGGQDAANELKTALQRGEFPCIGATTAEEYKKHFQHDPALDRRFVPVRVGEPDPEASLKIVEGVAPLYGKHHGITYAPEALHAAVQLSARFIHDRFLPGKAINVMDMAGSRARHHGRTVVERVHVAEVVSEVADVPLDRLVEDDQARFLRMEEFLGARIVGHREVMATVAGAIRRAYAGFVSQRPMASFLFLGPTGVGKTETVKALADFLFGSREAVIRLDMSEYAEAHAISRLIGSPPGYVGHDDGGQLTDGMRRKPFSIVLLDEVEKAHRDVLLTLLQVLDEGRLTDARGRTVSFRNAVVVMTSNLGSDRFEKTGARAMGFAASPSAAAGEEQVCKEVLEVARKAVPIELWGRIDERLVFRPLQPEDVERIGRLLLVDSAKRLKVERNIELRAGEDVVRHLMAVGGYSARLGARPMRQAVQRHVETVVAEAVLAGALKSGDVVEVVVEGERLRACRVAPVVAPGRGAAPAAVPGHGSAR
jgi:ATP-dependent Clp protease ATP-binding subunit ClpC